MWVCGGYLFRPLGLSLLEQSQGTADWWQQTPIGGIAILSVEVGDGLLSRVCDARLDSVAEQLDLVVHAEFVHHMGPVDFNRAPANRQSHSDFLIVQTLREHMKDLSFSHGQPLVRLKRRALFLLQIAFDNLLRERVAEVAPTKNRLPHGMKQIIRNGVLENIGLGPGPLSLQDIAFVSMHGQNDHAGLR